MLQLVPTKTLSKPNKIGNDSSNDQFIDEMCAITAINSSNATNVNNNNNNNNKNNNTNNTNNKEIIGFNYSMKWFHDNLEIGFGLIGIGFILFTMLFIKCNWIFIQNIENNESYYNLIYIYLFIFLSLSILILLNCIFTMIIDEMVCNTYNYYKKIIEIK